MASIVMFLFAILFFGVAAVVGSRARMAWNICMFLGVAYVILGWALL